MIHYCGHCDYNTERRWDLAKLMNSLHKHENELADGEIDLIEESIEVWKIYKLLQRINKKM